MSDFEKNMSIKHALISVRIETRDHKEHYEQNKQGLFVSTRSNTDLEEKKHIFPLQRKSENVMRAISRGLYLQDLKIFENENLHVC